MAAELSMGIRSNWVLRRMDTRAFCSAASKSIRLTRPTSTPDIETWAPALRSPTLSNMAVTSYIGCEPNEKWRLLICVNKKASAATPSNTNPPAPRMVLREYCMSPPCCPPAGSIMRYRAQHCDHGLSVEISLGQSEAAARLRWRAVGQNDPVRHGTRHFYEDPFH